MTTFIDLKKQKKEKLIFSKPGDYVVFMHNLSGKFTFDIRSKDVRLDIYGLFLGRTKDDFSVHTIQNHSAPSSTSNLFIKGVFYDYAKFHYQGLIRIEKKAQKSHAYQKNQNIIMSPFAFIESKPYLEILANDVFCTHGSTTGKLNSDQLFYAETRGLEQEEAKQLLVDGFVNEIIFKIREKIPDFDYENS
jgi:Fe-S cluster assembly protein SufD